MPPSILRDNSSDAVLSDDRQYRYRLWRQWDVQKPAVGWLMLNPSTADEVEDDHTIRRCIAFAKSWGYGAIDVANLFALRSSEPADLRDHPDPIGPETGAHLERLVDETALVIAAWGNHGEFERRAREVAAQLEGDLHALKTNATGHPGHPLFLSGDLEPEPFSYGDADE